MNSLEWFSLEGSIQGMNKSAFSLQWKRTEKNTFDRALTHLFPLMKTVEHKMMK